MKKIAISKKQKYSYSILNERTQILFVLSCLMDFTYVKSLVEDSLAPDKVAGTCAFGLIFRYLDDQNYMIFLLSDKNYFCVNALKDNKLIKIVEWTKLEGKDWKKFHRVKIIGAASEYQINIDGKKRTSFIYEYNNGTQIALAAQNYSVHEKIECGFDHIFLRLPKRREMKNLIMNVVKNINIVDKNAAVINIEENEEVNPVTDEKDEVCWKYYGQARQAFIEGNLDYAKSAIMAASSNLSENIAVLELYSFIQKEENNLDHALRLIKSDMKHAPYISDYADECRNLLSRLTELKSLPDEKSAREKLLKFSMENRGIFPIEKSFISADL
ncbi:MAG: hypothetical protein K5839_00595, partial [Treponemataceae bacterium]|nr:hypothetical protein [Treponemataceae bacterium]